MQFSDNIIEKAKACGLTARRWSDRTNLFYVEQTGAPHTGRTMSERDLAYLTALVSA